MSGQYAGQGWGSVVTEPGLVGTTGQIGGHRTIPPGAHGFATFRHDEAATARVARLKPMRKCEGESDE